MKSIFLTRRELGERWKKTEKFIANILPEELPRIDIGGGKGRKTYLYRLSHVQAYEDKHLCSSNKSEGA